MRQYKIIVKVEPTKIFEAYLHDDLSIEVTTQETTELIQRRSATLTNFNAITQFMRDWNLTAVNVTKV